MCRQPRLERVEARGRSTVHQRRVVPGQQVGRDDPGVSEEVEVEKLGAVT